MPDSTITGLTAVDTVATDDELALWDTSGADTNKATVAQVAARINRGQPGWGAKLGHASQYHCPDGVDPMQAGTQTAASASMLVWWAWYCGSSAAVNRLSVYCYTLESGSLLRLGIYAANDDLSVGALLSDFGTASGATTGQKDVTGSATPGVGWCYLAVASSTHTTVRWGRYTPGSGGAQAVPLGTQVQQGRRFPCYSYAGDYSGALPAIGTVTPALADTVAAAQYACPQARLAT